MKAKEVLMILGIIAIFSIFIGMLADKIGKDMSEKCNAVATNSAVCCQNSVDGPEVTSKYYFLTESSNKCSGTVVDKSLCKDNMYLTNSPCWEKSRNVFSLVTLIAGIILVGLGLYLNMNNIVESALIGTGIISLIMSLVGYWSSLNEWFRIMLSGVIAGVLIYIAYKKMK